MRANTRPPLQSGSLRGRTPEVRIPPGAPDSHACGRPASSIQIPYGVENGGPASDAGWRCIIILKAGAYPFAGPSTGKQSHLRVARWRPGAGISGPPIRRHPSLRRNTGAGTLPPPAVAGSAAPDRPVSPMAAANLGHCVGKFLADDVEGAVDLVRDRVHTNNRTQRDQGRDQSVLNEILAGFIPVQIRH